MSSLRALLMLVFASQILFHASAEAATYDLKEVTPQIQQAISGRQARYTELQQLKADGVLGETSRGYVEVRQNTGNAASIAAAENKDRSTIYHAIVSQNNLGGAQGLAQVEAVFGEVQREKARPGDWVQSPSGQWSQR